MIDNLILVQYNTDLLQTETTKITTRTTTVLCAHFFIQFQETGNVIWLSLDFKSVSI